MTNSIEANDDPALRSWRAIAGCLVGEVRGHPSIDHGWMITSLVLERGEGWARTTSRRYRLEAPWPDGESMPAGAASPLVNRILSNLGASGSVEATAKVLAAAERIAAEVLSGKPTSAWNEK